MTISFMVFISVHVNSLKAIRGKQKMSILWCVTIMVTQFDTFIVLPVTVKSMSLYIL